MAKQSPTSRTVESVSTNIAERRRALEGAVTQLAANHGIAVHRPLGRGAVSLDAAADRLHVTLQLPRAVYQLNLDGELLTIDIAPEQIVELLDYEIADGAAVLRGVILRGILLGAHRFDLLESVPPAMRTDAHDKQRIDVLEKLAALLLRLAKDDLAERIGMQLLEGFAKRGLRST